MTSLDQWQAVLGFLGVIALIAVGMLGLGKILGVRARAPSPLQRRTYECGEEPTGAAWMQFNVRFYLLALVFVLFDVEVVFLFPWTVVIRAMGPGGTIAVAAFVAVLMLGWLYAVRKEALKWQ